MLKVLSHRSVFSRRAVHEFGSAMVSVVGNAAIQRQFFEGRSVLAAIVTDVLTRVAVLTGQKIGEGDSALAKTIPQVIDGLMFAALPVGQGVVNATRFGFVDQLPRIIANGSARYLGGVAARKLFPVIMRQALVQNMRFLPDYMKDPDNQEVIVPWLDTFVNLIAKMVTCEVSVDHHGVHYQMASMTYGGKREHVLADGAVLSQYGGSIHAEKDGVFADLDSGPGDVALQYHGTDGDTYLLGFKKEGSDDVVKVTLTCEGGLFNVSCEDAGLAQQLQESLRQGGIGSVRTVAEQLKIRPGVCASEDGVCQAQLQAQVDVDNTYRQELSQVQKEHFQSVREDWKQKLSMWKSPKKMVASIIENVKDVNGRQTLSEWQKDPRFIQFTQSELRCEALESVLIGARGATNMQVRSIQQVHLYKTYLESFKDIVFTFKENSTGFELMVMNKPVITKIFSHYYPHKTVNLSNLRAAFDWGMDFDVMDNPSSSPAELFEASRSPRYAGDAMGLPADWVDAYVEHNTRFMEKRTEFRDGLYRNYLSKYGQEFADALIGWYDRYIEQIVSQDGIYAKTALDDFRSQLATIPNCEQLNRAFGKQGRGCLTKKEAKEAVFLSTLPEPRKPVCMSDGHEMEQQHLSHGVNWFGRRFRDDETHANQWFTSGTQWICEQARGILDRYKID